VAELVWKGKEALRKRGLVRERRGEAVTTDEAYGAGAGALRGRLVLGDGARVLTALLGELRGRVDLIYIDPPFDSGVEYEYCVSLAPAPGGDGEAGRIRVPAYRDALGMDAWLDMFFETARLVREVLREGGSLYVHLDAHAVHYAKVVLDEVFGSKAFQRDIVWRIGWVSGFKSRAKNWIRNHDTILYYVKPGATPVFHKEYIPYPHDYARRSGARSPGPGFPIEDVWNANVADRLDSIQIMSFSGEKVGYPTQKNESLLARIVRCSSNPDDLVVDCFGGSGTTAIAAHRLGRRWVVCDSSPLAIHATRKRLLAESPVPAFEVQSLGDGVRADGGARISLRTDSVPDLDTTGVYRAEVALDDFQVAESPASAEARSHVSHFSQWIEGWCLDWDYQGGALRAGTSLWRSRGGCPALRANHDYAQAGRVVVRVRVYDVFGGVTTCDAGIEVRA
jgi:DNA modification methylase